jgi:thioredoxin 2
MSESTQVVCSNCGQINRLPAGRPASGACCGSCRQPIFSGRPIEVDEQGFGRQVARSDVPLLVDIWAPWCGPCRAMAPTFERAAKELEPNVRLLKLNSDTAPTTSSRLGITGIPTLLLMRGGREISRRSGAMDTRNIVTWARAGLAGT